MNIKRLLKLIIDANRQEQEKEQEERVWQLWKLRYGNVDKAHFVSYEDFKKEAFKETKVKREIFDVKKAVKENMAKAEKIKAMDKKHRKVI